MQLRPVGVITKTPSKDVPATMVLKTPIPKGLEVSAVVCVYEGTDEKGTVKRFHMPALNDKGWERVEVVEGRESEIGGR